MNRVTLLHGWGKDVLPQIPTCSIDSCVCDPPYGLSREPNMTEVLTHWLAGDDYNQTGGGFMGKSWDSFVPGPTTWKEVIRVLKPGAFALVFAGSRTVDLMAISMRLAGFEIRDQIQWIYGSGFPKSLDISKALDKMAGAEREKVSPRSIIGHQRNIGNRRPYMDDPNHMTDSDTPVTAAAAAWQGWGTALKPAHEPIIVARKPLEGTVAANVATWGVGGLNIDGCRVGESKRVPGSISRTSDNVLLGSVDGSLRRETGGESGHNPNVGRFPANIIHDGSDEVLACFPDAPGQLAAASADQTTRKNQNCYGDMARGNDGAIPRLDQSASAARFFQVCPWTDEELMQRFFYCAKASSKDRGEGNTHPTVKPQSLMRYLCRLVTPAGGVVLDSFAGSGTTGVAALDEGFRPLLIEQDADHFAFIYGRIFDHVMKSTN